MKHVKSEQDKQLTDGSVSGVFYTVRRIGRESVPQIVELDKAVGTKLSAYDKPFYYDHDEKWYNDFMDAGNKVIGLFNADGDLVAKSNLTVDAGDLSKHGFAENSRVGQMLNDFFGGDDGSAAILSGVGTHPDYRQGGFQRVVLTELFKYARNHGKTMIAAIVEPRNYGSLRALTNSGMSVKDVHAHPVYKADYFHLVGNLKKITSGVGLAIPMDNLRELNGTTAQILEKIERAKENPQLVIPLDMRSKHVDTLYKSDAIFCLTRAFEMGYNGRRIISANEVQEDKRPVSNADPGTDPKDILYMYLER